MSYSEQAIDEMVRGINLRLKYLERDFDSAIQAARVDVFRQLRRDFAVAIVQGLMSRGYLIDSMERRRNVAITANDIATTCTSMWAELDAANDSKG